jgi:hypothetical protein
VAKDEVVNILLSGEDLQKLQRAVARIDMGESSREFAFAESDSRKKRSFHTVPNASSAFAELDRLNWNELDWLSFN